VEHAEAGAPAALDSVTTAFAYKGVPRIAVHRLKYAGLRAIAPSMAAPMTRALFGRIAVDAVVPVPLHPIKLRGRGFNQTLLLARGVGEAIGVPVWDTALERLTNAGSQVDAPAQRPRCVGLHWKADVVGLRLVLVDDVVTTGATLASAARSLKAAGAAEVHGLTFALGGQREEAAGEPGYELR
jgi:predicted amidophosphoribosyltransferase